jgi:drug/metabolite transporter (DMT)-like permease
MLAIVAWASPAVIAKGLPLAALPIVFYRGWIGVAWALGALFLVRGRFDLRVLRYSFLGGILLGLDLVLFFTALKLTTVANATLIGAMQPVLLIFAAPLLFKERVRWPDALAALIAIVGAGLVAFGSTGTPSWSPRGDLFAFLTLFAWTGYLIASKRARRYIRSTEFAAGVTLVASIVVTLVVWLSGQPPVLPAPTHLAGLTFMAVSGWCGHVLMNWALGHIPIWVGGSAALAVPVVASTLAAIFLGELFLPIQVIGMVIVLVSLTFVGMRAPQVLGEEPA